MQLREDYALAQAIKSGQRRDFILGIYFDWGRDGTFSAPDSDMSDNFVDIDWDKQLAGNVPSQAEITDGYMQAQLNLVLGGVARDSVDLVRNLPVPLVKLFSPYQSYLQGSLYAKNTKVILDISQRDSGGVYKRVRQFTGYLVSSQPDKKTGEVSITIADVLSQVNGAVTIYPYATANEPAAWADGYNPYDLLRGSVALVWYIDQCLRQSGVYAGPPAPARKYLNTTNQAADTSIEGIRGDYVRRFLGPSSYETLVGGELPEYGAGHWTQDSQGFGNTKGGASWDAGNYNNNFGYNLGSQYIGEDTMYNLSAPDYPYYCYQTGGPFGPYRKRNVYTGNDFDKSIWLPAGQNWYRQINKFNSQLQGLIDGTSKRVRMCYGMSMYFLCDDSKMVHYSNAQGDNIDIPNYAHIAQETGMRSVFKKYPTTHNTTPFEATWPIGAGLEDHQCFTGKIGLFVSNGNGDNLYNYEVLGELPGSAAVFSRRPALYWIRDSEQDGSLLTVRSADYVLTSAPIDQLPQGWNYIGVKLTSPASVQTWQNGYFDVTWNINGVEYNGGRIQLDDRGPNYVYTNDTGLVAGDECPVHYRSITGGTQHVATWVTTVNGWQWSRDTPIPGGIRADLDISWGRTFVNPYVNKRNATEVAKELVAADLGVLYADEYEKVRFDNHVTIRQRRATDSTLALTHSDTSTIDPYTDPSSVYNMISLTTQKAGCTTQTVYKLDNVNLYVFNPSKKSYRWIGTAEDAISTVNGGIYERWEAAGQRTGTTYAAKDLAKAYGPDFWLTGFCITVNKANAADVPIARQGFAAVNHVPRKQAAGIPNNYQPDLLEMTATASVNNGETGYLSNDNGSSPFFNVRGRKIVTDNQATSLFIDQSSIAKWGQSVLERGGTDWTKDYYTQYDLSMMLLSELSAPKASFSSLTIPLDIRLQTQDVIQLRDPDSMGAPILLSVVGIKPSISRNKAVMELTLRTLSYGEGWMIDDRELSVMGRTTILT